MLKHSLLLMGLAATGMLHAEYVPTSNCSTSPLLGGGLSVSCNLYPSDGSGNFDGNITVAYPNNFNPTGNISPGYIVMVSNAADIVLDSTVTAAAGYNVYDDPNMSDWLQVLDINPSGGYYGQYMNLYTLGCGSGLANPTDNTCFPSFSTIQTSAVNFFTSSGSDPNTEPFLFVQAPADGGFFDQVAGPDNYDIYYVSPALANAPEPSTFVIFGIGLAGMGVSGLRRRFIARR